MSSQFDKLVAGEFRATQEILAVGVNRESVSRLAGNAAQFVDWLADNFLKGLVGRRQPDCKKGCTHCCTLRVTLNVVEIFFIAQALQSSLDKQTMAELITELKTAADLSKGKTGAQWVSLARKCVFLGDEGECQIYPIRPLRCRTWHSLQVSKCKDGVGRPKVEIPQYGNLLEIGIAVGFGVEQAVEERNLQTGEVELNQGLLLALTVPGLFEQWRSGKRVFPITDSLVQIQGRKSKISGR